MLKALPQPRKQVLLLLFILVLPPLHVSQLLLAELGLGKLASLGIVPLLQPLLKCLALDPVNVATPMLPENVMTRPTLCGHAWSSNLQTSHNNPQSPGSAFVVPTNSTETCKAVATCMG